MQVSNQITAFGMLECSQGYLLLSCGYDTTVFQSEDWWASNIPYKATACACSTSKPNGVKCYAQCSNRVKGFQITSSPGVQRGLMNAICPMGTFVLGCHMLPFYTLEESFDIGLKFYPSDDGRKPSVSVRMNMEPSASLRVHPTSTITRLSKSMVSEQ